MIVQAGVNQSIIDIAIQYAGSCDAAFGIASANGIGLTDVLVPGQSLVIPTVIEAGVAERLRLANISPAYYETETQISSGVGYWYIDQDFIVQ
jgi:hypothetical protein